jgi:hypothetical protein
MSESEIDLLVQNSKWATIISISSDGYPYAIEATPFIMDGDIGFMINPKGGTSKNMENSNKVLLKYTMNSDKLEVWAGVSLFGIGAFSHDPEVIKKGWEYLGHLLGTDYSGVSQKFVNNPQSSPLFMVKVERKTGRCSYKTGEEFKLIKYKS